MIFITVTRDQDDRISEFKISGHADYDEPGKDIVCSAVSAASIGTINAIEKLLDIIPEIDIDSGFLHCVLPTELEKGIQEKVQLLLEAMVVTLESIANTDEYRKYITLKT